MCPAAKSRRHTQSCDADTHTEARNYFFFVFFFAFFAFFAMV